MRIQHNIMAMNAYRNYTNNVSAMKANLEKLSSGYKINRAGDDAAGLAISEKMRAQITGLETAQKNAKDGISLVQTAEGALTEVHDMLNRMVELATQSANGTYDNETDRVQLQKELDQLRSEINRIADSSNFNGIKLLDGSMSTEGAPGMTSALDSSLMPDVGVNQVLGQDTVLRNYANSSGGTQFSMDFHNVEISNGSDATYTLKAGDIEITFAGVAASATATGVTGDKIIADLLAKGIGTGTNFEITSIKVGGSAVAAASVAVSGGKVTISGTKYGDIEISQGSGGSNRLTFTQVNAPKDATQVWEPAGTVRLTQTVGTTKKDLDGHPQMMSLSSSPVSYSTTTWDVTGADTVNIDTDIIGKVTIASATGVSALGNLIATSSDAPATLTNVTLSYDTDDDDNDVWTITAGDASFAVTVDYSNGDSSIIVKNSTGTADLFTIALTGDGVDDATVTDIQGAFSTAKTIGTYAALDNGETETKASTILGSKASAVAAVIATATTASAVKAALASAGLTAGSTVAAAPATVATLKTTNVEWDAKGTTAVVAASAATLVAMGTVAITSDIKINVGNALKAANIDGTSNTTLGAVRDAILDALQVAANKVTASQVAANATTITVYSNFRFVDANGSAVTQAAGDGARIAYDTTTYSNTQAAPQTTTAGVDYQFETTAVNYVGLDGGDRIASTYIAASAIMDKVADGNTMTIGTSTYTFTTDKANDGKAGYVFIGENGSADAKTVARRLSWAARDNSLYTVGADDKGHISFVEKDNQQVDGFFENGKSTLTTKDAIANSIKFATGAIAAGGNGLTLQIGDTSDSYNQLTVSIGDCHTSSLGIADISIADQESAADAIKAIKEAINKVSDIRGTLGATQNRLDHTINNLSVMTENIQDAESTIRDTDVAEEMMEYTKNNILIQSAQAMLAQANQVPQGVLQLLQ